MRKALTGDLSLTASDGTVLTDSTDLGLAWKWAEKEYGQRHGPEAWKALSHGEQSATVADALAELRRAYRE